MNVVSIDVGIKNLSLCWFYTEPILSVRHWDNLDISQAPHVQPTLAKQTGPICQSVHTNKKNKQTPCKQLAKWTTTDGTCLLCNKHAQQYPCALIQQTPWKSYDATELRALMQQYCPAETFEGLSSKTKLQSNLKQYLKSHQLSAVSNKNKTPSAKDLDLTIIGRNLMQHLDLLFADHTIDLVLIENQIGPLAIRMKTIQGMIAQYFIMRNIHVRIEFVNAINKLKVSDDIEALQHLKDTYSQRKQLSIQTCLYLMQEQGRFVEQLSYFQTHKKQDDLADCLLQGLWFLEHKKG